MSKIKIKDSQDAIFHYPRYFDKPSEVIQETALSKSEKIKLLKGWKQDIELEEIAEDENMPFSRPNILDEIAHALRSLGFYEDTNRTPPNKFGGM